MVKESGNRGGQPDRGTFPDPGKSVALRHWDPEDEAFWSGPGKRIATRNLWISIPNLLCGFAVWLYWSIIIVQMQNLHALGFFPFAEDKSLLYTLPAIAGLAGATLRIPNSFMIAISGGRNVIFVTSLLLIAPSLGIGIALQNSDTSWITFAVFAALSGVGGGVFASSMSNISFFFPKRVQGTSLGLNAGLGNVGVSVMQVLLPFVMTFGLFGALGGGSQTLPPELGGGQVWIQNCGLVWVPILVVLAVLAFFFMNNLPQHNVPATPLAVSKMLWLELLGFAGAAVGLVLLVSDWGNFPDLAKVFIVLLAAVTTTLALMRFLTPKATKENLRGQFAIFREKHNWVMTWLYTMTFGSFIGYSAAFPKLIQDVFGNPARRLAESERAEPTALRLARPAGRLADPARRGLAFRPAGRRPGHAVGHGRDDRRRARRGLHRAGCARRGNPRSLLVAIPALVHALVHDDGYRQRLHVPHDPDHLQAGPGRSGSGLDLGHRGIRCVSHPTHLRHADPGRPRRVRAVRLRALLPELSDRELVVLRAEERGNPLLRS